MIMIVITAGRTSRDMVKKAKQLAETHQILYKERSGVSIKTMKMEFQDDVLIVGKNRLVISPLHDDQELFFHPNLAMVRAKRILNGEEEPLVSIAKLKEGMSFLDCTLGLASDSIIASLVLGDKGLVTGIEANPKLYLLTKEGLSSFVSGIKRFDCAMRAIDVVQADHGHYLKKADTNSFDVVYLDPMFSSSIETSNGINSIRNQAFKSELTLDLIQEAKRVAKQRVVLKDHWQSQRFKEFGFTQYKRKTALFHYGVIELNKEIH